MAASDVVPPDPPRWRWQALHRLIPLRTRLGSYIATISDCGFQPDAWWRNYLHQHTYFEICFAFAGHGVYRSLGRDLPVAAGQVFIAKPGEEHEIISGEDEPLGIYYWGFTLVQDPSGSTRDAATEAIDRLLGAFAASRRWVSARVPGMLRTIELITEEIVRAEPGYSVVIESLARKLVLDTARAAVGEAQPGEERPVEATAERAVEEAKHYIAAHLHRELLVRDVARAVNLSLRHFTRLFHARFGTSAKDYLIDARVAAAAQLLLDRTLTVKDVARRLGYRDVRYFTTVFRQRTGMPPATYRLTLGHRIADVTVGDPAWSGVFSRLQREVQRRQDLNRRKAPRRRR